MLSADQYIASMQASIDMYDALRPRSMQKEIGVSDLGRCRSAALWKLTGVDPTDAPNSRQALHGTALHDMWGQARQQANPHLLIETELKGTLPSGIEVIGHADEIDPAEPSVTDWKSVGDEADLAAQRRNGSEESQRWQRHLYYYLAHQMGLVPAEGIVRNWWADRAGYDQRGLVEQEPFDMNVVHEADRWLQDILYAAKHGEEVTRDKHWSWCQQFCDFFSHCRGGTQHPDMTITDAQMVTAARNLLEGRKEAKEGTALETAAKRELAPLQAVINEEASAFILGDIRVRVQWVNTEKGGYWKYLVSEVAA